MKTEGRPVALALAKLTRLLNCKISGDISADAMLSLTEYWRKVALP
jgi:hypothetical protein